MKHRIAIFTITLAAALVASIWFMMPRLARDATHSAEIQERLQLLWPDFQQMSNGDRRVMAVLGTRCRLHKEPLVPHAVARCLRTAAASSNSPRDRMMIARKLPALYQAENSDLADLGEPCTDLTSSSCQPHD